MQQVAERLETLNYFYDNRSSALDLSNTKIPIPGEKKPKKTPTTQTLNPLLVHLKAVLLNQEKFGLNFFLFISPLSLQLGAWLGVFIFVQEHWEGIHWRLITTMMENLTTVIVLSLDKCLKFEKQAFKHSFTLLVLLAKFSTLNVHAMPLQGVMRNCCAPLNKRWKSGTTELPQRSSVDCNYFMFAFVFWHHQVRGVGGVHAVVVIKYNRGECLMKWTKDKAN